LNQGGVIMHLGVFLFNLKRSVVIVFLSANKYSDLFCKDTGI